MPVMHIPFKFLVFLHGTYNDIKMAIEGARLYDRLFASYHASDVARSREFSPQMRGCC